MEKWLKKSYPLIMLALLFVQAIISPLTVWAQTTLGENKSIVNLKELSQEDTFEIDGKHLISLTLDYENTQESTVFVGIQTNEKMTVNKIEDNNGVTASIRPENEIQLTIPSKAIGTGTIQLLIDSSDINRKISLQNGMQVKQIDIPAKKAAGSENNPKEESNKQQNERNSTSEEATTQILKESNLNEEKNQIAANREPLDISTLFKDGDKFIQSVAINVSHDGKNIDYTKESVPGEALISFNYDWQIPQHLLDDRLIQVGDYLELSLPDSIKINPISGNLISSTGNSYGTYEVTPNGKIRWTFNGKIEEENDISGQTLYSQELKKESNAGNTTIKVPIDGGEELVTIHVDPFEGNAISKQGFLGTDNKSIRWEVSINTHLEKMTNATIVDPLPEGLELKKITIYPQIITIDGKVTVGETPLVEGVDYLYDSQTQTVKFVNQYAQTQESFQVVYDTTVKDSGIPYEGGEVKFKNKATLNDGVKDYSAEAMVTTSYGKLLEKSAPKVDNNGSGQIYSWQIKLNGGNKVLPPGYFIKDTLKNESLVFLQDSVVVKDEKGIVLNVGTDYVINFNGNELTMSFPDGLNHAMTIDYKTKFTKIIDGELTEADKKLLNEVTTMDGYTRIGSGNVKTDGLIKNATVDYTNRKITWTIEVNRFNYEMVNWNLKDSMSEGLVFNVSSFKLTEKNAKNTLEKDKDYTLSYTNTGFEVAFIGELKKGTDKTYVITYTTDFERRQEKFMNTAASYWQEESGVPHTTTITKSVPIENNYVIDATKGGSYNAQTKEITWTTIVNYNQDTLKNATISDPIIGEQEYVSGSVTLYEVQIASNGKVIFSTELKNIPSVNGKTINVALPDGNKAYALVFKTSLKGKYINGSYTNEATYTNVDLTRVVGASVTPKESGKIALKSGIQDPNNANYVLWQVMVNPSQSTLNDVIVVDEPSANQIIDDSSIKIYKTLVSPDGTITRTDTVLEKDKDYSVNIETNNETGKQVATVKFIGTVETSYNIEYRSLINTSKATDELTNKVSIKATNEKMITEEVPTTVRVISSGGYATGSQASVTLVKVDKFSSNPIEGVSLELWSTDGKGDKQQLVRSGVTDEKGELKFGNLRANSPYLIFETNAPNGYTVSEELANGKIITLKEQTESSLFQKVEITNERAKIIFKKVDEDTNTPLQGAVFLVTNEQGQFYNGIDEKGIVNWITTRSNISETTKNALTSNKEGIVEVVGLSPGDYKTQEISAPKGYVLSNSIYTFTVLKDEKGIVKLLIPMEIIKNKRKMIQIAGEKVWDDYNNKFKTRPESITVNLYRDDVLYGTKEIKETSDGTWKYAFDNLLEIDELSNTYSYRIEEMPVENYETKVEGTTITNTYRNTETTSVSGEKIWDDYNNKFNTRPESITVQLMQNGSPFQETTVKADEKGVWQYAFTNIAKYDETGNAYSYTVKEIPVENYETKVEGTTITNTYRNTETTSVSGEKIWDDYNNKFNTRPESIIVQLMQNGRPFQETTVKVDGKGVWEYAFTNIAKYDETGNVYSYTVKEIPVENYETKIEGTTITNTYRNTETTSVSGEKIWEDENNKYQKRPNSITINLFKNGKKLDVKTVSKGENGSWIFKFDQLEKYDEAGELINYTISEEIVEGYTSSIEGTTITNTYKQLGKLGTPRNMIKKTTDEQVRELPKTNEIVTNIGTMVGGILLCDTFLYKSVNQTK